MTRDGYLQTFMLILSNVRRKGEREGKKERESKDEDEGIENCGGRKFGGTS